MCLLFLHSLKKKDNITENPKAEKGRYLKKCLCLFSLAAGKALRRREKNVKL